MNLNSIQLKKILTLPWAICGAAALFYCYEYFLRVTPSVMQHELMQTLNINNAMFGMLAAFYYYAYTGMQIPVGVLMDRFGPRRLLTWACIICVIGSCLFAANSFFIAAIGRFLVGLGSAFAFVGVLKLAAIWLPPQRFAMVTGLVTVLGMLGPILGDVLLTPMVATLGWHQTVFISAFAGLILALILWLIIRDHNPQHKELKGVQKDPLKNLVIDLFVIFKIKQIWLAGIIAFCLYLPIAVFAELWGIPYLEQAHQLPVKFAAYINPLLFVGFSAGALTFGWLSDFIRRRREPLILGSIFSLIFTCILFYYHNLSIVAIGALLFLLSFFAGVEVITFAVSRDATAERYAGTAIAITNFITMLGGMIFQPIIGALLDFHATWMKHSILSLNNADYRFALMVLPICLTLAVILSFFVKNTDLASRKI